jgi:hypothetical protein
MIFLCLIILAIICAVFFWVQLFLFSVSYFAILMVLTIVAGIIYSLC